MKNCSVVRHLEIERGNKSDYHRLAHFHYRDTSLGPYAAIYVLKPKANMSVQLMTNAVGVIVYRMPSPALELRNVACCDFLKGLDRQTMMSLVNANIRCISRVIIEPRFRGLGLAAKLVRETMPLMGVAIIESMAVMGLVNPFFEKAGMTAYVGTMPARCGQLIEALGVVGVDESELIEPTKVHKKIESLDGDMRVFIESQISRFLQAYGKRRQMIHSAERTRYVLSKLGNRPTYYIWFKKNLEFRI